MVREDEQQSDAQEIWLLNVRDRQLELYTPGPGLKNPTILTETDTADLVIAGQTVGRIAVADFLPRAVD
jgi:hypothetical protein